MSMSEHKAKIEQIIKIMGPLDGIKMIDQIIINLEAGLNEMEELRRETINKYDLNRIANGKR